MKKLSADEVAKLDKLCGSRVREVLRTRHTLRDRIQAILHDGAVRDGIVLAATVYRISVENVRAFAWMVIENEVAAEPA